MAKMIEEALAIIARNLSKSVIHFFAANCAQIRSHFYRHLRAWGGMDAAAATSTIAAGFSAAMYLKQVQLCWSSDALLYLVIRIWYTEYS